MWHDLWVAAALMLVIEGIMPFVNPNGVRRMLLMMAELDDNALRMSGLVSMIIGIIILYVVN